MKRAALLTNPDQPCQYQIRILLQKNQTADLRFSDKTTAREHFEILRARGVIGTLAIKEITFHEILG